MPCVRAASSVHSRSPRPQLPAVAMPLRRLSPTVETSSKSLAPKNRGPSHPQGEGPMMEGWQRCKNAQTKYEIATKRDHSSDSRLSTVLAAWPETPHPVQRCHGALPVPSLLQSDLETVLCPGTSSPKTGRETNRYSEKSRKKEQAGRSDPSTG